MDTGMGTGMATAMGIIVMIRNEEIGGKKNNNDMEYSIRQVFFLTRNLRKYNFYAILIEYHLLEIERFLGELSVHLVKRRIEHH